ARRYRFRIAALLDHGKQDVVPFVEQGNLVPHLFQLQCNYARVSLCSQFVFSLAARGGNFLEVQNLAVTELRNLSASANVLDGEFSGSVRGSASGRNVAARGR